MSLSLDLTKEEAGLANLCCLETHLAAKYYK